VSAAVILLVCAAAAFAERRRDRDAWIGFALFTVLGLMLACAGNASADIDLPTCYPCDGKVMAR
jgi:hypothetical protein